MKTVLAFLRREVLAEGGGEMGRYIGEDQKRSGDGVRGVGVVTGVRMGVTRSEDVDSVGVRWEAVVKVGACTSCTGLVVVPVSEQLGINCGH